MRCGLERREGRAALPTVVIESKPFGKDRAAFEAELQSALDQHKRRADLPRRLHAAVDRGIRAALVRPDAQHPSLVAAVVSRARSAWPGAARRREDFRRDRAFRHSGNRRRSDRDAGRGRGQRSTIRRRRLRRGSSRSSTASIRMRCGCWQTGGVRLEGDICKTPDSTGSGDVLISPVATRRTAAGLKTKSPGVRPGVHHDRLRGS